MVVRCAIGVRFVPGWAWPVVDWPWPAVSGGRAGVYCMVCGGVRCTLGGPCASVGAGSGGMRCAVGGVRAMVGLPCDGVACAVRSVVVEVVRCMVCARCLVPFAILG